MHLIVKDQQQTGYHEIAIHPMVCRHTLQRGLHPHFTLWKHFSFNFGAISNCCACERSTSLLLILFTESHQCHNSKHHNTLWKDLFGNPYYCCHQMNPQFFCKNSNRSAVWCIETFCTDNSSGSIGTRHDYLFMLPFINNLHHRQTKLSIMISFRGIHA